MTILSIAALVMAVFTLCMTAFAWFYTNISNDVNDFNVQPIDQSGYANYFLNNDPANAKQLIINNAMPGDSYTIRVQIKNETEFMQPYMLTIVNPHGTFQYFYGEYTEPFTGDMCNVFGVYIDNDYSYVNNVFNQLFTQGDPTRTITLIYDDWGLEPFQEIEVEFDIRFYDTDQFGYGHGVNIYQGKQLVIEAIEVVFLN
jgi:hypothetical protein